MSSKKWLQLWIKGAVSLLSQEGADTNFLETKIHSSYHYIRARGLGGDGPKDIISSVSAEFVVALRNNRVSKPKTEKPSLAERSLP